MSREWIERSLDARILVVDDIEANVLLLQNLLRQQGYRNVEATMDPRTVAPMHRERPFELILLDVQMPGLDGFGVMRELQQGARDGADFLPVIVVTAFSDQDNRMKALTQGARDFILKPFAAAEVAQRIRNYLEVRMLYDERRRESVVLEQRVAEQVAQLEGLGRLRRFFSPQLAERILAGGVDDPLRTHRREITAVSIDLRGFTAFTEKAEPEEVMQVLHEYHATLGSLILRHEGTIEWFAGDGIMVIFNDPVPLDRPAHAAVRMALEMHAALVPVAGRWARMGYGLGMGIGISQGYATIGRIGFEGRWDYAAIGSVTNLAARLCGEARSGQTLVDMKVMCLIDDAVEADALGEIAMKGFSRPVASFSVLRMREARKAAAAAG